MGRFSEQRSDQSFKKAPVLELKSQQVVNFVIFEHLLYKKVFLNTDFNIPKRNLKDNPNQSCEFQEVDLIEL